MTVPIPPATASSGQILLPSSRPTGAPTLAAYTIEHISGFVANALEQLLLQYLLTPALHSLFNFSPRMQGEPTGTPILRTRDEHNWMFNPKAAAQSASYFWDTYLNTNPTSRTGGRVSIGSTKGFADSTPAIALKPA